METQKSSSSDSVGRRASDGCRPHVHFKDSVIVILIPCRLEYFAAGLTPILWWMKADFVLFRKSAIAEFATYKRLRGIPLDTGAKNVVQHREFHPLFRETTDYLCNTASLDREPSRQSAVGDDSLCWSSFLETHWISTQNSQCSAKKHCQIFLMSIQQSVNISSLSSLGYLHFLKTPLCHTLIFLWLFLIYYQSHSRMHLREKKGTGFDYCLSKLDCLTINHLTDSYHFREYYNAFSQYCPSCLKINILAMSYFVPTHLIATLVTLPIFSFISSYFLVEPDCRINIFALYNSMSDTFLSFFVYQN